MYSLFSDVMLSLLMKVNNSCKYATFERNLDPPSHAPMELSKH